MTDIAAELIDSGRTVIKQINYQTALSVEDNNYSEVTIS